MEKHIQMLLFFCVYFMTSVHTMKWINVIVELGQEDAILNCSLDLDNVIWNIQVPGESPVQILRTFNKQSEAVEDLTNNFKGRYSVKKGNRLFIQNVTVKDMQLFYCTTADDPPFFNETLHLVSAVELPTKYCQRDSSFCPNGLLTILSLVLNVTVITALAALAGFYLSARRHNRPSHPDSDLSPLNPPGNPNLAVYEEIPSRTPTRRNQTPPQVGAVSQVPPGATSGPDCVYSKVQMPSGAGSETHSIYSKVQMHSGPVSAAGSSSGLDPTSVYAKVQKPVSTPTVQ